MSIFARRAERRAYGDTLADLLAQARGGSQSAAGPVVTPDAAMRLGAVWTCVNLLADIVSTMPVHEYLRGERVDPSPITVEPSATVDAVSWRRQIMVSWLLRGNVYGIETATGASGWPRIVEVAHPDWVGARQERRFGPVEWTLNGKPLDPARMHHGPAYTVPGVPIGLSPIGYARETIGLGIAATRFAAQFFADGAHPTAILKSDRELTKEQAQTIKTRFLEAVRGRREPAVLGMGLEYEAIQVAPDDSQFLETLGMNRRDVAAIFLPHLILSEAATMTYSNVESRSLDLLVFDVQPWLVRLEQWMSRLLPRGRTVKINADALVRTTLTDRYRAHAIGIASGFLSPDEAREKEDRPPIPGGVGSQFLWPPARADSSSTPDSTSK